MRSLLLYHTCMLQIDRRDCRLVGNIFWYWTRQWISNWWVEFCRFWPYLRKRKWVSFHRDLRMLHRELFGIIGWVSWKCFERNLHFFKDPIKKLNCHLQVKQFVFPMLRIKCPFSHQLFHFIPFGTQVQYRLGLLILKLSTQIFNLSLFWGELIDNLHLMLTYESLFGQLISHGLRFYTNK